MNPEVLSQKIIEEAERYFADDTRMDIDHYPIIESWEDRFEKKFSLYDEVLRHWKEVSQILGEKGWKISNEDKGSNRWEGIIEVYPPYTPKKPSWVAGRAEAIKRAEAKELEYLAKYSGGPKKENKDKYLLFAEYRDIETPEGEPVGITSKKANEYAKYQ